MYKKRKTPRRGFLRRDNKLTTENEEEEEERKVDKNAHDNRWAEDNATKVIIIVIRQRTPNKIPEPMANCNNNSNSIKSKTTTT